MPHYFALLTVENNKNKKSVKFQGDMLNFCDFIQVFVFTTNHHLNVKQAGVCEMAVHRAVAGDVFDNVLLYVVLFPTRCLG